MQLSGALSRVFANNKSLIHLVVSFKHAHFEDCLKIAENLISSMKAGLNNLRSFNKFPIYDYIYYRLTKANLCEKDEDFDYAHYDPLYCALVIKLLMFQSFNLAQIDFNPLQSAINEYLER